MSQAMGLRARLSEQIGVESAAELANVLGDLRQGAAEILGDALVGAYLTGSFALGQGDRASDVDFLVVTGREPTPADEDRIGHLHAAFPDRAEPWAQHLEGSWVSADALRDPVGHHAPWLYVDNGSREMERSRHDDTWNGRWVLRDRGIPLVGPSPRDLVPAVAASLVRAETIEQAEAKAAWIRAEPEALVNGWAQPYVVLTLCRLLWSATFGTVASKGDAALWAMEEVAPLRFRDVIGSAAGSRLRAFDAGDGRADPSYAPIAGEFVEWASAEVARRAAA